MFSWYVSCPLFIEHVDPIESHKSHKLELSGLRNPFTVADLKSLVRQNHPHILFLIETKLLSSDMNKICAVLAFPTCFKADNHKRAEGLAILWFDDVQLFLLSFSSYHTNYQVNSFISMSWRFNGLYTEPRTKQRFRVWNLFHHLHSQYNLSWFCIGDFNEILNLDEKDGVLLDQLNKLMTFVKFCNKLLLLILASMAPLLLGVVVPFPNSMIKECLDHAVATPAWTDLFPKTTIWHLPFLLSDHKPLLIK